MDYGTELLELALKEFNQLTSEEFSQLCAESLDNEESDTRIYIPPDFDQIVPEEFSQLYSHTPVDILLVENKNHDVKIGSAVVGKYINKGSVTSGAKSKTYAMAA